MGARLHRAAWCVLRCVGEFESLLRERVSNAKKEWSCRWTKVDEKYKVNETGNARIYLIVSRFYLTLSAPLTIVSAISLRNVK